MKTQKLKLLWIQKQGVSVAHSKSASAALCKAQKMKKGKLAASFIEPEEN
jgi:hypothetical protein